jgi:hypothetical protein
MAEPRSLGQRKTDTLARLTADADCWVATADEDGTAYLVPLSFSWDGSTLLLATLSTNPTGRNLQRTGRVRLGVGPTRDVIMVDGTVETFTPADVDKAELDLFAERTGFDPSTLKGGWRYFRVTPVAVQAWRESNEIPGRDLMADGEWLV